MEPLVSVVLPVFNNAAYLPSLLSSLLAQSEQSLEVIAVDDGSTDASFAVLQAAAQDDSRLVVLRQEHHGVSAARNRALGRVRGRWIAFADGDDWLSPRTLQSWREYAEEAKLDLVIGNGFTFEHRPDEIEPARALLAWQPWGEIVCGRRWIEHAVARKEWPHYLWLQLARREVVLGARARFVEEMVNHSDVAWTLDVALAAQRIGFFSTPLYGYRRNPRSLTHNVEPGAVRDHARSYLLVMRRLLAAAERARHDPGLHEALIRHLGFEGRNFLNLVRKRLTDDTVRRELSREYLALGLTRVMFAGASSPSDYWHVLRYWAFAQNCARH